MIKKRAIKSPKISIVVPAFNESENIGYLCTSLKKVLSRLGVSYEIVLVDDGSTDGTVLAMRKEAVKNKKIMVLELARNFGQTAALSAGFGQCRGKVVVTMDADLQNDPEDIPRLLKLIDKGYDLVSGWRKHRQDKFLSRKLPSIVANKLIAMISGVPLHDFGCSLKAYRREIVENISLYGEMHRFIPAVAVGMGAKIAEIEVEHHPRKFGKSKYGLSRIVGVVLDVMLLKFLLSFQSKPMRLFGGLGMLFAGAGSLVFLELTYEKFVLLKPLSQRPLFLVSIFMMMVGIQLVMIGIFSEMLMRIYFESTGRKIYRVRRLWKKNQNL